MRYADDDGRRVRALLLLAILAVAVGPVRAQEGAAPVAAESSGDGALPDLTPGAASFDAAAPAEIAVKRAPTGHLLVRPVVNGHDAGWFIFDSGAGICVVSSAHAGALGLSEVGSIGAIGVGGGQVETLFRAATVQLGPLLLRDHPLMATDLAFLAEHLGDEIAGVVGYGLLARCVAEVDLATPRLLLHDPQGYVLPAGEWAPMSLEGRVPSVEATFEEHAGLFRLDLGANSALTFHEPAVRRYELLEGRELADARLGGVGGFVQARRGVLASFELAGVRREQVPVEFAIEPKGTFGDASRVGNIGAGLLQAYEIVLDYGGQRLALRARGG